MARRSKSISKRTVSAVEGAIGTIDNLVSISENLSGMISDGTVEFRKKTPVLIEDYLSKRKIRKAKEIEIDELEIENELLELKLKNQELKSKVDKEPVDKAE